MLTDEHKFHTSKTPKDKQMSNRIFNPNPLRITVDRPAFTITRNQSFFKLIHATATLSEDENKMEDCDQEQQDIETTQDENNLNRDQ